MEAALSADVLIIGAGVIGLATGYELARRGADVLILERNEEVAREASWAAAGILHQRITTQDAYGWLARTSLDRYCSLAKELFDQTGVDIGFRLYGGLELALTQEKKASLHSFLPFHNQRGIPSRWLEPEEIAAIEPNLTRHLLGGVLFERDAQVRPPRLADALAKAIQKHGGRILTDSPATDFLYDSARPAGGERRVVGVRTPRHTVYADKTLLAAGCWSGLLAEKAGIFLPVRPVKGQMLLVEVPPQTIRRTVNAEGTYFVQRDDGAFLVGATLEEVGFNKETTEEGIEKLRQGAIRACPLLEGCQVLRAWAGLRPAPARRYPYIFEGRPGLWAATGHFRQGILMAPATALLLAHAILDGKTPLPLEDFNPEQDRKRVEKTRSGQESPSCS